MGLSVNLASTPSESEIAAFDTLNKIKNYIAQAQYEDAGKQCEWAIEQDETTISYYWYLGLALLLQGQEAEAQITWMTPILEAEPEQAEPWTSELLQILEAEAEWQAAQSNDSMAWVLRQHIRELAPEALDNLLHLLKLELRSKTFSYDNGLAQQITQVLQQIASTKQTINLDQLLSAVQQILKFNRGHVVALEFLEASVPHIPDDRRIGLAHLLMDAANECYRTSRYTAAIQIAKFCAKLAPDEISILMQTASFLCNVNTDSLIESIPFIEQILSIATDLVDRITATHFMLTSLMSVCSSWKDTHKYYQLHKQLLTLVQVDQPETEPLSSKPDKRYCLLGMGMFFHYFEDAPDSNRLIRNRVAQAAQDSYRSIMSEQVERYSPRQDPSKGASVKPLKIAYLSECLRVHSVGWLVRWLLKYHNRDRFEVHLYSMRQADDFLQQSLMAEYSERFHSMSTVPAEVADQIYQDEIDILVDLDSMTSFVNCAVAALKPAPVQVSWLGYDATGIPAIDYFIADPYVLPESAQEYYSETIWRLPHTYIAVDGFEIGVPTLRREHLNIPSDAIVYLSSQTGLKRNPDNIRLQLQILKHVPNSYFLVKSYHSHPERLQAFFLELAEEEGLSDRLRFLPDFPDSSTHRANLRLADVVLDTYPYNGATTTLEALWMGLPIVTRVGQQFAARNSYTMLMNVGISEGIAWTDEEYVNWGIRLGEDAALRRKIICRLRQSHSTSPLWNSQQFTHEMESAYEQMWQLKRLAR